MSRDDDDAIGESISTSFLLAGAFAIEALADTKAFRAFLEEKSVSKKGLLPGMKLAFDNLLDDQVLQSTSTAGFELDDDRITRRAIYKGIPIEEVRSNSSRARVLRGLKRARDNICKETTLPDFQAAISEELSPWFEAIKELFENHTEIFTQVCKGMDKKEVLHLHAFSWFIRFLNIAQQIHLVPLESDIFDREDLKLDLEARRRRKIFDKSVKGWKTSAAYLWSRLEGKNLPEKPVDLILQCESWEDLDDLFRPLADSTIAEVDKKLGSRMGAVFLTSSECRPKSLSSLMVEYDMTMEEKQETLLDHSFLWYHFEILDGAHPKIFPGVSTFTNLLLGTVLTKESFDWASPIEVRRVLHPRGYGTYKDKEGKKVRREHHDISYAILVPSFSTVADYSGWLVSLGCCNNYSGFAGGMREQAEATIEAVGKHLNVEDIKIPLDEFRNYLRLKVDEQFEKSGRLSTSEWESIDLRKSIELGTDMSAVIIELFLAVTMAEAGYDVHWQYKNSDILGKKEIDVLAVREDETQIIECSRHFPLNAKGIGKIVSELKRKEKLISNSEFHRQRIRLRYVTAKNLDLEPFKLAAQEFRKAGISAESIQRLLEDSRHKTRTIGELLWRIESLRRYLH